ncbi:MAG: hypothetical protein HOG49_41215 [Candidatus Scalindua sp.]|nr:hypothetical protein [Candidatus Scalindua sp.]
MIKTKKSFCLKISEVSRKFRVENNNLDISEITKNSDFDVCKISDLCVAHRNNRDKKTTDDTEFRYVQISDIDTNLGIIKTYRKFLGKDAPNNARRIMTYGDILVSTRRPTRGAVVAVPKEFDGNICTVFFTTLTVNDWERSDPRFLALYLRTSIARYQFQAQITETAYPVIAYDDVLDIEVLLPKKEVQLEIVRQYEESLQQYFEMLNGAYRNVAEAKGYIEKELLGNFSEIPVIEELKLNANEIVVDD